MIDSALVRAVQRGDRDAYERLARAVSRQLFLVASRILRDGDAAEDAVQQTLVVIWRDLGTLRDPERFEAWAYRVVVRFCRSEASRLRRSRSSVTDVSHTLAAAGDAFTDVDRRDQLGRAFDRLSQDHRAVVVLHHLAGLPLAEVAEVLDVPYGTVGSRLHRAMQEMRASIEAGERAFVPGGQLA